MRDLKWLRCPHNWGFDSYEDVEERLLSKLTGSDDGEIFDEDESETQSNSKYASKVSEYQLYCLLSYEKYRKGQYEEALEFINKTCITDDFMDKYDRVFKHVSQASKAHILYKMDYFVESTQIIRKLKVNVFNKAEEAGFKYLESRLRISYGELGASICVELIESAIQAVEDEPEFHYSLAKILSFIRHINFPFPVPTDKELNACRKAVFLKEDCPSYSILLARLYMEQRFNLPTNKRHECIKLAASIYRNLLQHESLSGSNIASCLFNLIKLDFDPDLERFAELALKKSDSILVNHYIGLFYIRNNQMDKALKCLNKLTHKLPFICNVVLVLMYRINNNLLDDNEIDNLVKLWTQNFKTSSDIIRFHLSISQFYLLVKSDLLNASAHFLLANKHGISKGCLINITKRNNTANYLSVLIQELKSKPLKNEQEMEALEAIQKLPWRVVTPKNPRWIIPSLHELQQDLI